MRAARGQLLISVFEQLVVNRLRANRGFHNAGFFGFRIEVFLQLLVLDLQVSEFLVVGHAEECEKSLPDGAEKEGNHPPSSIQLQPPCSRSSRMQGVAGAQKHEH